MRLIESKKLGVCPVCGEKETWVNRVTGEEVAPVLGVSFKAKRIGHEVCAAKERAEAEERQRREFEESQRKAEAEKQQRWREQMARELDWPFRRYDELLNAALNSGIPKIETWDPSKPGLLLYGTPGVGKSFTMRVLACRTWERHGLLFKWCNANRWFDQLRSAIDHAESETVLAETTPVLFIDDLGAEKLSEWAEAKLERILSLRFDFGLPVFVSTNLTPSGFQERFGHRIVSRLTGLCELVQMSGADRRPEVLKARR